MKVLLDTHILLWALVDNDKIAGLLDNMLSEKNDIYFSIASLWEIEIKNNKNPKDMPISGKELMNLCFEAGLSLLSIEPNHIFATSSLKRNKNAPSHKDPFDKLLISQAKCENMMFVTHDELLKFYNEPCVNYV